MGKAHEAFRPRLFEVHRYRGGNKPTVPPGPRLPPGATRVAGKHLRGDLHIPSPP